MTEIFDRYVQLQTYGMRNAAKAKELLQTDRKAWQDWVDLLNKPNLIPQVLCIRIAHYIRVV